ncbi:sensor histidine kinase [Luteimonas sp. R10]|uniref:sensor histidine kinase n=1 Tax=Luteimonas sp. R10 TaxID=3108176 RepID=UPI003090A7A0|nr:histidine kinase [Luteimonas sp. R10]
MRRNPLKLLAAVVGCWTLYGLLLAAQLLGMEDPEGRVMPAAHALRLGLASGLMWIPLTLLLLWWVRRWPIECERWLRSTMAATALVLLIVVLRAAAVAALNPWIGWYQQLPGVVELLWTSFGNNALLVWLMVGVAHAWLYARRALAREREAEQLQARLTETRLDALRAQLNPHFMFNALNSIAEMVHRDADAADRMLVGLGELLRSSLDHQRSQLVPLHEELQLLRHYLEIEKARLGERLRLEWRVEPGLEHLPVPPMLLQPLAENAILHAIAEKSAPGLLRIAIRREGGRLWLEVGDDGSADAAATPRHGTGLRNIRSRLTYLFGDRHGFWIGPGADGGTTVRLWLPCPPGEMAA